MFRPQKITATLCSDHREQQQHYVQPKKTTATLCSDHRKQQQHYVQTTDNNSNIMFRPQKTTTLCSDHREKQQHYVQTTENIKKARKLFNTLALPALLYRSENWTIKARDARRMTAAEMKYMRKTAEYRQIIKQIQRWQRN
jgi:hypothetical protein